MSRLNLQVITSSALAICVLLTPRVYGQGNVEAAAFAGRPFGVGSITLPGATVDPFFFSLRADDGRALYPVFTSGAAGRLLNNLLGGEAPSRRVEVYFLFKGEAPLNLVVSTPKPLQVVVTPERVAGRAQQRNYQRLLNRWWRAYHAETRRQTSDGDHPPLVQDYLTGMLQRRMGLTTPLFSRLGQTDPDETQRTLELLLGMERLRSATIKKTIAASTLEETAHLPIPAAVDWPRLGFTGLDPDVDIEPIAHRVPEECLYIRFGSFSNYLWLDHLLQDYGGDLGRMVAMRGHLTDDASKVQRQLALKKSALAELLGDQVIADVALIGRDAFLREGPAIGMLFQSRNGLFGQNLHLQRLQSFQEEKPHGATMTTVEIAKHKVSLLSTPDNAVRSYYAVDGRFHLVCTSREVVRRFLETADTDGRSLGQSPEFHYARTLMPTSRGDTVFLHLSRAFFQGLVTPRYQVELGRRLQSATDLDLLKLGRLAARNEGSPGEDLESLIRGGFLPPGFGRRPDGSGPIVTADSALDSRRGARGVFTPIPDIEIRSITASESQSCAKKAAHYQDNWKQFDPLTMGVKRWALNKAGRERVVIDAQVSPLEESKYGWLLSILGPPTTRRVTSAPNDILSAQAVVQGGLLDRTLPAHHLFLGIQDNEAPEGLRPRGLLQTLQILTKTPGYIGSWPRTGFLDWLPFGLGGGEPDALGYSQLPFGVWRRQWRDLSALSFHRDVLDRVTPHLQPVEDPTSAQIRVRIGDLSEARLRGWVNSLYATRAKQTTVGNLRLMQILQQQLGVEDQQARNMAEDLLDVTLICSLGGEYYLGPGEGDAPRTWRTTALVPREGSDPAVFAAPVLSWFRGVHSHLTKTSDGLVVRAELDMQRTIKGPALSLPPLFELFGGAKNPTTLKAKPKVEKKVKKGRAFE